MHKYIIINIYVDICYIYLYTNINSPLTSLQNNKNMFPAKL